MNILYILTFKEDPLIEIGFSTKGSFEWLYQLLTKYKVSLKDSYLVSANQRQTITKLRSSILKQYGQYTPSKRQLKKYNSTDGLTQILKWDCLDAIIDILQVESKNDKLGICIVTMDEVIYPNEQKSSTISGALRHSPLQKSDK